jgi:hypothetical protein
MPKELLHFTLAGRAFRRLPAESRLKRVIGRYTNAYFAGAVLPDTPYYARLGPDKARMQAVGGRIHDPAGSADDILTGLVAAADGSPENPHLALALGVVSHIRADAAYHPYVCHLCGHPSIPASAPRHQTLEAYLDIDALRRFPAKIPERVARVFHAAGAEHFSPAAAATALYSSAGSVPAPVVRRALMLHGFYQALFFAAPVREAYGVWNTATGGGGEAQLTAFYPHVPSGRPLFSEPIPCRHAVTGEAANFTPAALAEQATADAVRAFSVVEKTGVGGLIAKGDGPNLLTGFFHTTADAMDHFDTGTPIPRLVFGA